MSLFTEAGVFAYGSLLLFVAGLAVCLRARDRAVSSASAFSAGIAGFAMLGAGAGQRMVDKYIHDVPELAERVLCLSAGTREAQANMVLAGGMILMLMLVAAGISALSPRAS